MEMKNICGKIPVELHEKLKLEVEELGISIPKYLEMVIEEHMTRKGENGHGKFKNSSSTGNRGFIFQTESSPRQKRHETERLPDRTDRSGTRRREAKWKAESEEAEETEGEPAESEMEDPETAESEPDEESAEPEADEEPTEPENEEPAEAEPTELETEEAEESEPEEAES